MLVSALAVMPASTNQTTCIDVSLSYSVLPYPLLTTIFPILHLWKYIGGAAPITKIDLMAKRILSISYDRALLWTRQLLLEQLGYEVRSAEGFSQAWDAAASKANRFDLIILGHSIPPTDKQAIVSHMRDSCDCPILALLRPYESPVSGAAVSIDAGDPNALLGAVRKMLEQ